MSDPRDPVRGLWEYLDGSGVRGDSVLAYLQRAWPFLAGGDEHAMAAHKLSRIEDPSWEAPILRFKIERHGGTVKGSSRAEVQEWRVDLDARTAETTAIRTHRQLRPLRARLDVERAAQEIAAVVVAVADDPRLRWSPDRSRVQVHTSVVVNPDAASRQTVEGRRKRLVAALRPKLEEAGWRLSGSWYERA